MFFCFDYFSIFDFSWSWWLPTSTRVGTKRRRKNKRPVPSGIHRHLIRWYTAGFE